MILGLKTAYKTQVGKFKSGAKFKSKFRKIELPPSPPAGRDDCRTDLAFLRPYGKFTNCSLGKLS